MKREKRSPITDKPLRHAGQSLDEQREELLSEKLAFPLVAALVVIVFAGLEWWEYYHPRPRNPLLMSLLASLVVMWALFRIRQLLPVARSLSLAREGERAVGEFLERLREKGYRVFHDVVGDDFNLDHVIIGPAGVFTIETKTIQKPRRGSPRIKVDGDKVLIDGIEADRNPVVQAKAQASWLQRLLKESTSKSFHVRPVVVYPGWYVEQSRESRKEIWVLEPKALPGFLANEPTVLPAEDIALASLHLSRFIRSVERVRKK
jgi:hypothetical protein